MSEDLIGAEFGGSPALQVMRNLAADVARRALAERRRQLEAHIPMDSLLTMKVSREEMDAWVNLYHAPFAFGIPLRESPSITD